MVNRAEVIGGIGNQAPQRSLSKGSQKLPKGNHFGYYGLQELLDSQEVSKHKVHAVHTIKYYCTVLYQHFNEKHPPSGEKLSNDLGGNIGCRDKIFMVFNQVPHYWSSRIQYRPGRKNV